MTKTDLSRLRLWRQGFLRFLRSPFMSFFTVHILESFPGQ